MNRLLIVGVCVLTISTFCSADEGRKPNTLSAQEIADGWILLFDGETTFGWTIDKDHLIKDGVLSLGGTKPVKARLISPFREFDLYLEYGPQSGEDAMINFAYRQRNGSDSESGLGLIAHSKGWTGFHVQARLDSTGGYTLTSRFLKPNFLGAVADSKSISSATSIAIAVPAQRSLTIRNIRIKPIGLNPIFNGQDLSNWKEIKSEKSKSKFSVENGELKIKDGPGDLQTVGQWDDFVLQMDVKTNGRHLNSGVFFRCLPGEFWAGYESQISNAWIGARTKPVDFGTGGIYRRQPARRVVSNDNEWFTKTIIAHDHHMAVWVNGYQVSDFTDMRLPANNARQGSKKDKGAISLQGHDPTTDLSFRNIRLAELPKSK